MTPKNTQPQDKDIIRKKQAEDLAPIAEEVKARQERIYRDREDH